MKKFFIGCLLLMAVSGCRPAVSVVTEKEAAETQEPSEKDAKEEIKEETKEDQTENNKEEKDLQEKADAIIYVDICGAVCSPGVYQLAKDSRVFQAVEAAGGFREDAAAHLVNQADYVQDGQQIRIYTKEEAKELEERGKIPEESADGTAVEGRVNLNLADKAALMTLTGIGETRAEAILAYREQAGGFAAPEELMQVEGIKEKTYDKIKDQITVD